MNIKIFSKNPIFLFLNVAIFLALIWPFVKPFAQPERHRLMREKRIALELKTGNTPRQVAQWLDDNRLMFSIYDKGKYRRGNSDNKIPLEYYYDELYYPYKKEKRNINASQYVIVSQERKKSIACFNQTLTYYFYFDDEKQLTHYEVKSACIDTILYM